LIERFCGDGKVIAGVVSNFKSVAM